MAEGEKENNPIKNDSGEETDDESEVLEESPCGRWQKRREEVDQRDVPGIDNAFLAMDTEEGVEVVWNEVQFSEKKNFRAQQDKIHKVFDNLIQLDHPNIVKFHKYWTDTKGEKPRVIFITEYMSSGSLKQFLHRTKKNNKTFQLKQWKRWCTQILSALSYLHSCDPPIIHGNLTCDTIFIQHNGLIKIGSVAPEAINMHVKTYRDDLKNMHCIAPEYGEPYYTKFRGKQRRLGPPNHGPMTTKVDIYAFGMCALEMAALGIQGNGDGNPITESAIKNTLASLEDSLQREGGSWTPAALEDFPRDILKQDFLQLCINKNPHDRPTARELLFHAVLFEVHSLKLLAAHAFVKNNAALPENVAESAMNVKADPNKVLAEVKHSGQEPICWTVSKVPALELEKLLEDVRNGIYPLTAFSMVVPPPARQRALTPELAESVKSETPEPCDVETRTVVQMHCQVVQNPNSSTMQLNILLRMNDKINRQLQCDFSREESASMLADELVHYGFINQADRENIAKMIHEEITSSNYGQKVSDVVIPPIPSSS